MGWYWNVAERYATLLQRVLDEYRESERAPAGMNGLRETPSTVRILADMRRCAYDLDFLISRQPRQYFGQAKGVMGVTPVRTPAPNELEYLDVFDFFNMPRLPVGDAGAVGAGGAPNGGDGGDGGQEYGMGMEGGAGAGTGGNGMGNSMNEFNITNFTYDANADWFVNGNGR